MQEDNRLLSYIHPDAFDGWRAEEFSLTKLHLAGNDMRYLPRELLPDKSNWEVRMYRTRN